MYLIASLEKYAPFESAALNKALLFLVMAVLMTVIEYIAGILALKCMNLRLWDYSMEWRNINGIICPKFSVIWALFGALYYFLIHPYINEIVRWLGENVAFSFFIGMFFGVFLIDVAHSMQLAAKIRKFADENDVIVRYEHIKAQIRSYHSANAKKYRFFSPFATDRPLSEHLKAMRDSFEKRKSLRTRR